MIGMAFQQGAQDQQLIQRPPLRLGLHRTQKADDSARIRLRLRVIATADVLRKPAHHPTDVLTGVLGEDCQRLRHMVGQPGVGAELHSVRDLVQTHPQPEVGRVDLHRLLRGDDVRRDKCQTTWNVLVG